MDTLISTGSPSAPHSSTSHPAAFLEVRDVVKGYGEGDARVEVLKSVSVTCNEGELCVLLGPSGSGKSTFLNLVGGLESVDAGTVRVGDTMLSGASASTLSEYRRRELGFVFQFYNLVPDLTVRENIEVCAHIAANPLPVDDLLRSLGLWEQRAKFPRQISGGQQQRCAIGRALAKNPRLLLCDEPTGALDSRTSRDVLELLSQVRSEYGCTVIIVTHNDAIRAMADHVLRLRDCVRVEDLRNDCPVPASQIAW